MKSITINEAKEMYASNNPTLQEVALRFYNIMELNPTHQIKVGKVYYDTLRGETYVGTDMGHMLRPNDEEDHYLATSTLVECTSGKLLPQLDGTDGFYVGSKNGVEYLLKETDFGWALFHKVTHR